MLRFDPHKEPSTTNKLWQQGGTPHLRDTGASFAALQGVAPGPGCHHRHEDRRVGQRHTDYASECHPHQIGVRSRRQVGLGFVGREKSPSGRNNGGEADNGGEPRWCWELFVVQVAKPTLYQAMSQWHDIRDEKDPMHNNLDT